MPEGCAGRLDGEFWGRALSRDGEGGREIGEDSGSLCSSDDSQRWALMGYFTSKSLKLIMGRGLPAQDPVLIGEPEFQPAGIGEQGAAASLDVIDLVQQKSAAPRPSDAVIEASRFTEPGLLASIVVQFTGRCNLRCVYCPQGTDLNKHNYDDAEAGLLTDIAGYIEKQEIQFECNPVYGQTPNYYEATFKVNSTEYTTGNNIAIGCTVKGAPQYSSISFNASEPVTPESVIEHITSWNMQNNIGFLDYYWFEWNATNATPDGECGELGFQNVSQGSFPPSSTASWANITMQLPPQCNDTYIAWYQTANGSSTKVTAQGYLVDRYGWLNVTLDTPTPGQLTEIDRYNTFWMNATIKCVGTPSQPCGSVNAYARRNSTGPNPDTTISTIVGQQPFWTPNANPYSCGPMPLCSHVL